MLSHELGLKVHFETSGTLRLLMKNSILLDRCAGAVRQLKDDRVPFRDMLK